MREVEKEWREVLGEPAYHSLQSSLALLNQHFEDVPIPSNHTPD